MFSYNVLLLDFDKLSFSIILQQFLCSMMFGFLQLSGNVSSINRLSICLMLTFLPLFWHVFVYTLEL